MNRHMKYNRRAGYTLVELLVVIGIMLLITTIATVVLRVSINGDKVRTAARQVQSYFEGARSRAIFSKQPRGVRLVVGMTQASDPSNARMVTSLAFVEPSDPWREGFIQLERYDENNDMVLDDEVWIVRGFDNDNTFAATKWAYLRDQGLLLDGARIQIPADTGNWYRITTNDGRGTLIGDSTTPGANPPRIKLTTPYREAPKTPMGTIAAFSPGPTTYLLELPPKLMANQEPVLLPSGTVIHLDRCSSATDALLDSTSTQRGNRLPSAWKIADNSIPATLGGFRYSSQMDVMFSPRGVITGPSAAIGVLHFYISERIDAERDHLFWSQGKVTPTENGEITDSGEKFSRGDKVLMSLFTRTGAVSSHPVHDTDRFRYAETGEVAGR